MDSTQMATVIQIYEANPETAIHARAILAIAKKLKYAVSPYNISITRSYNAFANSSSAKDETNNKLIAYPNPASNELTIEYTGNDLVKLAELTIYNSLGAIVEKHYIRNGIKLNINTQNYNNGIYFITLTNERGVIEKQRFIINK